MSTIFGPKPVFFEKTWFGAENRRHQSFFRATYRRQYDSLEHPKVSNRVYGSSRIRIKCFGGNLRHVSAILSHLKFGQKIRILAALVPKTLEKVTQLHLSSVKKGATMHFKRLKIFSWKNSAKIDEFCTLFEVYCPSLCLSKRVQFSNLDSEFDFSMSYL